MAITTQSAVPLTTTGAPAVAATYAQGVASVAPPGNGSVQAGATSFSAAPSDAARLSTGAGLLEMVAWGQRNMDAVQDKIKALFKSEGEVDAAQMSVLNTDLQRFQMFMEELKKMQEIRENAARVWLR